MYIRKRLTSGIKTQEIQGISSKPLIFKENPSFVKMMII